MSDHTKGSLIVGELLGYPGNYAIDLTAKHIHGEGRTDSHFATVESSRMPETLCNDAQRLATAYNATYGAGINPEGIKGLVEALRLANDAMEHMGEKLNEMDVVDEESILKTTPAFHAVHEALANLKLEEVK